MTSASELEIVAPVSEAKESNADLSSCILALIDQLPEAQKRALTMYELEGVSQTQIAEMEAISLSAAKSRVQRGRKHLETLLHHCCLFQLDTRGNIIGHEPLAGSCASNCGCQDSCGS